MLPQTNATLTLVRGPGPSEDYDAGPTDGPEKWRGRVGVYLRQRDERVPTGQTSSVVISRALIVPASLRVDWTEGDALTLETTVGDQTATVRGVERFPHPTAVGETRLVLEDA